MFLDLIQSVTLMIRKNPVRAFYCARLDPSSQLEGRNAVPIPAPKHRARKPLTRHRAARASSARLPATLSTESTAAFERRLDRSRYVNKGEVALPRRRANLRGVSP